MLRIEIQARTQRMLARKMPIDRHEDFARAQGHSDGLLDARAQLQALLNSRS